MYNSVGKIVCYVNRVFCVIVPNIFRNEDEICILLTKIKHFSTVQNNGVKVKLRKHSIKEAVLYSGVSISAYWFANAVLWIPWKFNHWLGIALMILLVPFLWGLSSIYCYSKTPFEKIKNTKFIVAIVFLFIAVISDFFFFAIWRRIPEQLYHPTTFAAYALIIIMPIIIGIILHKKKINKYSKINIKNILIIWLLGIIFLIITLYSVQFW